MGEVPATAATYDIEFGVGMMHQEKVRGKSKTNIPPPGLGKARSSHRAKEFIDIPVIDDRTVGDEDGR